MLFPVDYELGKGKGGVISRRSAVEHELYDDREACVSTSIAIFILVDWFISEQIIFAYK